MKCPKCGYNSFEYLDSCKKCSSDLTAFKQSLGIRAVILPLASAAAPVAALAAAPSESDEIFTSVSAAPAAAEPDDSFAWDLPAAEEKPAAVNDDVFSDLDLNSVSNAPSFSAEAPDNEDSPFGDFSFPESTDEAPPEKAAPPADDFMSLLDDDADTFSPAVPASTTTEAASSWDSQDSTADSAHTDAGSEDNSFAGSGDFDISDFSWGEEAAQVQDKGPQVKPEGFSSDEFDDLFGDTDGSDNQQTTA